MTARTTKRRLWRLNNGDSVSVDSRGDMHFFNCLFSATQKPPERCEGWDKAEKYPYRVQYCTEEGKILYSDIQKLVCPSDCRGDCRMDQWKEFDNVWEVQEEWYDKEKVKHPWNSLGLCQQDDDRHGQAEDR